MIHVPRRDKRSGFSLLEVMLATAILASSAMVLSSLLGLGTKLGCRAESRPEALSAAQSLLAEFLVLPGEQSEREEERTGILNSNPPRAFRIRMVDVVPGGNERADTTAGNSIAGPSLSTTSSPSDSLLGGSSANAAPSPQPIPSRLVMVTVEVFDSAEQEVNDARVLCQLSQLARIPVTGAP